MAEWKRPWYDFWSEDPEIVKKRREQLFNDISESIGSGDIIDQAINSLVGEFKEGQAHRKRVARATAEAEILPLEASNAYYKTLIKSATANVDLEIEAGRIQNARMREEVNALIATNRVTETQSRLLYKIILELNFEGIEPSQAFELVRQVMAKVKEDENIILEEKKALEALELAKVQRQLTMQQVRRESAQADIEEFVRDETIKK